MGYGTLSKSVCRLGLAEIVREVLRKQVAEAAVKRAEAMGDSGRPGDPPGAAIAPQVTEGLATMIENVMADAMREL